MKKTKRQQNAMIINLVFNTVLCVAFLGVISLFIYPNMTQISVAKQDVNALSSDIERIAQEGLSFDEFTSYRVQNKDLITDTFIEKLLEQMDAEFYSTNLKNIGSGLFTDNLTEVKDSLENQLDDVNETNEEIETILPAYGDYVSDDSKVITDFLFTSYLERLFSTFGLQYSGKIGVGELKPIGVDNETQSTTDQELDASLYVTNLKLDIAGRKQDILNFIHYFENVGSVNIQNEEINVYTDDTIVQLGRPVVLSGDNRTNEYNIYLQQLGDIESISMNQYIDSSLNTRDLKNQDLVDFVKQTQGTQRYELEISLNFYFKGLPQYKSRELITQFIQDHNATKKVVQVQLNTVSKKSSPSSEDRQYIGQLQSIDAWLIDTTKQVQLLAKNMKTPSEIESTYRQVLGLKKELDAIEALIEDYTNSNQ